MLFFCSQQLSLDTCLHIEFTTLCKQDNKSKRKKTESKKKEKKNKKEEQPDETKVAEKKMLKDGKKEPLLMQ